MRVSPVVFALLCAPAAWAADPRGDNPGTRPSTPEEEQASFHLPPGFVIQLVAAEPEIQKPINFNFDARGRLWVTGSEGYPWPAGTDAAGDPLPGFDQVYHDIEAAYAKGAKAPAPVREGRDSVRILSDFGANGRAHSVSVFADRLNIPGGVEPLPRAEGAKGDSAVVYSIPYIWRLEDTTGSGHADKREQLYGPFGYLDTHGGCASFIAWIDGWIYGTHGFRNHSEIKWKTGGVTLDSGNTYRFKPDGSAFEYYTHGQTNPFGLTFDPMGNLYSADSHSKPVYMLIHGGYYEGIGKKDDGLGFAPRITDDDHGSSAIGGIAYYADDKWPEEYRGNLFNGNPVTRRVNRDKLEWTGSTPKAIRQPDFVVSDDPWFRPVQLKMGPDGALYIADFYNAIIGHYEVALTDPHRDHTHGRIWRVVYKGDNATPPADLAKLDTPALVQQLGDPNLEVRRLATNELVQRGPSVVESLQACYQRPFDHPAETEIRRWAHALWAWHGLRPPHPPLPLWPQEFSGAIPDRVQFESEWLGVPGGAYFMTNIVRMDSNFGLSRDFLMVRHTPEPPLVTRAALESCTGPACPDLGLSKLLQLWKTAPAEDTELTYAAKVAARNQLWAELDRRSGDAAPFLNGRSAEEKGQLAELALSIPGPQAADLLYRYLIESGFGHPRAGDLLRQAVLSLEPAARLSELPLAKLSALPLPRQLPLSAGLADGARQRGLKLSPEIDAWMEGTLLSALDSSDAATVDRTLAALRDRSTEAKLEPLRKLVLDFAQPERRRLAALEAVFNCASGPAVVMQALADPFSLSLRKRAADLLGQRAAAGGDDARTALQTALATAPFELATTIGSALARSDLGAQALLDTVQAGKAPAALLRNNAVAGPLASRAGRLRDEAAALTRDLPPEDARLDKVIAARAAAYRAALAKSGEDHPDAERGKLVFLTNCAPCHKIKNQGGNIGPNLDGVSARGVDRLMEDILDPNRNVDPAFRQVLVETADGQTLAGVGPHRAGELLVLSDAQGREVSVPAAQVKSQTATAISLMPPGFEQLLPEAALLDLAAFLLGDAGP